LSRLRGLSGLLLGALIAGAPVASALAAAEAQARGAALRSGLSHATIDQVGQRARDKAASTACNSADLATVANRVRTAFEGYSRLQTMTFPGDAASWKATREVVSRVRRWRLSQPAKFGWDSMVFGLAGLKDPPDLLAVVNFSDGALPYSARLVARDTGMAPEPFLNSIRASMPPRSATRAILAEARGLPNPELFPDGATSAIAFRFPAGTVATLANLDPREVVAIDYLFAGRSGESVRTAYIEVGDFAAGVAFLAAAQR